jgi:hypothetical protein
VANDSIPKPRGITLILVRSYDRRLGALFQMLLGASFTVNGAGATEGGAAFVSAATELRLTNGVSVSAKFDGGSQTYAGTGIIRYAS